MKNLARTICWAAGAAALAAMFSIPVGAIEDWRSQNALGDVVVTFQNQIRILSNAGAPKQALFSGIGTNPLAGINQGPAFDAGLFLYSTNTTAGFGLLKVSPDTHTVTSIATTDSPESIAFAADGSYYTASRSCTGTGSGTTCTATVKKYASNDTETNSFSFSIGSSSTCIAVDADPDGYTLYLVDGATQTSERKIHTLNVSTSSVGSIGLSGVGSGAACGIRVQPPQRNKGASYRTFWIADHDNLKRVDSNGALLDGPLTVSISQNAPKNWIGVELDPNTFDIWAIDDGKAINVNQGESLLAKFRTNPDSNLPAADADAAPAACSTTPCVLVDFGAERPRGVTVNGALRGAQAVQFVTLAPGGFDSATFLQGTTYEHQWMAKVDAESTGKNATREMAILALERKSYPTPAESPSDGSCVPSLDIGCRLDNFKYSDGTVPTGKLYSRGRAVVLREIPLVDVGLTAPDYRVGLDYFDPAFPSIGTACKKNDATQEPATSTAFLRDPFQHQLFTDEVTAALFPTNDELWTRIPLSANDSIAVSIKDAKYLAEITQPSAGFGWEPGSTLTIAVDVRVPVSCGVPAEDLTGVLVLTATDETTGTPIADSEGVFASFSGSGIQWSRVAGQYRAHVSGDPNLFTVGHTIRFTVTAKLDETLFGEGQEKVRAIGDVSVSVIFKAKRK